MSGNFGFASELLETLKNVADSERDAYFISVIALIMPDGQEYTFEGRCNGSIAYERHGDGGFGYDPVFYIKEHKKTFSELGDSVKNTLSHRYVALVKVKEFLKAL